MRKIVLFFILSLFFGIGQSFANTPIGSGPSSEFIELNQGNNYYQSFLIDGADKKLDSIEVWLKKELISSPQTITISLLKGSYNGEILSQNSISSNSLSTNLGIININFDNINLTKNQLYFLKFETSGFDSGVSIGIHESNLFNEGTFISSFGIPDITKDIAFYAYLEEGNGNQTPIVANPIPNQNATQDIDFNFQFSANTFSDSDMGDFLTYSAQLAGGGPLPPWLSFDSPTRTFFGLPGELEAYDISIEVIADDGNGGSVTDTFNIIFGSPQPINATCGTAAKNYSYTENNYSGYFCASGLQISSPIFPGAGQTVFWTCAGRNGGVNKTCFATKSTKPKIDYIEIIGNKSCYQPIFTSSIQVKTYNGNIIHSQSQNTGVGGNSFYWRCTNGDWLWGSMWISTPSCQKTNLREDSNGYYLDYSCSASYGETGAAATGPGYTRYHNWTGTFTIPKNILDDTCTLTGEGCGTFTDYLNNQNLNTSQNTFQNIPTHNQAIFVQTQEQLYAAKSETVASKVIQNPGDKADPVHLQNGEFTYDNTLMSYPSTGMPFDFSLYYSNQAYYNGPVGNNWDFNFNTFLTFSQDGGVNYHNGKLGAFSFVKEGENFEYQEALKATLEKTASGYILNLDNTTKEYFDENGKLKKREDTFGNFISFERDTEGKLIKIIDTNDREYILSYYDHTRLQKITAFDGNVVEFEYFGDSEGEGSEYDLKNILLKNGGLSKSISFTYSTSETFEDAHNILKLIDSKGQTYVENTYENDRVTSQKYGNGTVFYDYTLSEDGKKVLKNRVTNRVGTQTLYTFNDAGLTTQKEIFGKNNQVFTYTYEYDEKGNLIKEIFPKGNGFEYAFDEKGNKISSRQKTDIHAQNSSEDLLTQYFYETEFSIPTKIIAPNGDETTFELDEKGNIVSQNILENGNNISTYFEYDSQGNITSTTDGEGNITQFIYDTFGQLIQSKKGEGSEEIVEQFEYDDFGNILSKTDGEGNKTFLTYSEFQQLKTRTNPLGLVQKYEYDANNNLTKSEIISGENILSTSEFTYDVLDKKIFSKTPVSETQNRQEILEYDANENIITVKDETNHITEFEYDERGNIVKKRVQSTPEDLITTYEYDTNGNLIKTQFGDLETTYEYDLFDRRIKTTSPEGNFQTFEYDKKSQVIKIQYFTPQNVLSHQTEFSYDTRGNMLTQREFLLQNGEIISERETRLKYDKNSQIIEKIFPDNTKETYEYDSLLRLKKSTQTSGVTTTFIYDKRNLIISQILTLGDNIQTTTFEYDVLGNLLKQTFPDGTHESFLYNTLGQKIQHTNQAGHITLMEYDLAGNMTKVTKPGNLVTHFAYNTKGQLTQLTDANGNITTYMYDSLGRLVEEKYPDNKKVIYTYNAYGDLATKQDPNGNIVTYAYDAFQRVQEKNITLGNGVGGLTQETFTYDALGRISQMQDNLGNTLAYEYDNFGNILSEIQNGKRVAYQYDEKNNQRTHIISPTGNVFHSEYDTFGNLSSIKQNAENIVNYEYQNNIILHKETLGNGLQTVKNYDAYLKLQSLNNGAQTYTYTYDNLGNITTDSQDIYSYDELQRLTKVEYDTLYDNKNRGNRIQNYEYDAMGNRTKLQNTRLIEKTQNVCTQETIEEQYTDKKGNTKTRNKTVKNCTPQTNLVETPQTSHTYTTNELNQYTNIENKNNKGETKTQIQFLYDNNGNLTEDESFTYTYDYKNRLIEMKSKALKADNLTPKTLITYTYDLQDRRISKTVNNNNQTTYLYAGKEILLETTQNKNGVVLETRENVFSNKVDDLLSTNITTYKTEKQQEEYTDKKGNTKTRTINMRVPTTQRYFYHKNHLGSITAISNQDGELVERYAYDVFGTAFIDKELFEEQKLKSKNLASETENLEEQEGETTNEEIQVQNRIYTKYNGKGILNNTRLFTGREFDKESKLYYYRARYYDPETGRFISRDPIGIADDINLYSYVKNNSVNFVDPSGLGSKPLNPPKTAEEHYARNQLNVNLPKTKTDAIKEGWVLLDDYKSIFHNFGKTRGEYNLKFISPNGHTETVYDNKNGNLVNDPRNMGTYNYYSPDDGSNHFFYDIIPYIKWGNSIHDTTTVSERIIQNTEILKIYGYELDDELTSKRETIKNTTNYINSFNFINDFNYYINYR